MSKMIWSRFDTWCLLRRLQGDVRRTKLLARLLAWSTPYSKQVFIALLASYFVIPAVVCWLLPNTAAGILCGLCIWVLVNVKCKALVRSMKTVDKALKEIDGDE
jgi:hypothetical protein